MGDREPDDLGDGIGIGREGVGGWMIPTAGCNLSRSILSSNLFHASSSCWSAVRGSVTTTVMSF